MYIQSVRMQARLASVRIDRFHTNGSVSINSRNSQQTNLHTNKSLRGQARNTCTYASYVRFIILRYWFFKYFCFFTFYKRDVEIKNITHVLQEKWVCFLFFW